MSRTTTSLRLDDELREKLARRAKREGKSVSALIERYVREGMLMEEHDGIVFNPTLDGGRVAFVIGGAKVWEIISALRNFEGTPEERILALSEQMQWHRRTIDVAVDYAATHKDEVYGAIAENDRLWAEYEKREAERKRLPS